MNLIYLQYSLSCLSFDSTTPMSKILFQVSFDCWLHVFYFHALHKISSLDQVAVPARIAAQATELEAESQLLHYGVIK